MRIDQSQNGIGRVKDSVAKWSWVYMGSGTELGSPTAGMISPCPQCFLGKWSAMNWLCVSLYICLHINRHLTKACRKVPLDYDETVARLSVVTKQHNTLFTSYKCQACVQMANWKQGHLAVAIVLRRLWTATRSENDSSCGLWFILYFPKVISVGKSIAPVENFDNQSAQKETALASL